MEQTFCLDSSNSLPYWNQTSLWNSTNPDFTLCFQETSLVWTPCLYFTLILLPYFGWKMLRERQSSRRLPPKGSISSTIKTNFFSKKSGTNNGNSSPIELFESNSKQSSPESNCLGCCCFHYLLHLLQMHNLRMFFSAILILTSLAELGYALIADLGTDNNNNLNITVFSIKNSENSVPLFETVTPAIKVVVFSLALVIQYFQWNTVSIASYSMFAFWLIFMLQSIINTRSMLVNYFEWNITDKSSDWRLQYSRYHNLGYVVIKLLGNFSILAQFILSLFSSHDLGDDQRRQSPPINPRPFASVLSDLTFSWVNKIVWSGFRNPLVIGKIWSLQVLNMVVISAHKFAPRLKLVRKLKQFGSYQKTVLVCINPMLALFKTFWVSLLVTSFLKLLVSFLPYLNTLFMSWLLTFIQHSDHTGEPAWHGYFYVFLMFVTPMTESFINGKYEFGIGLISIRVRSCLTDAIYCKSLRLSTSGRKHFTIGEIVNLMSIDSSRFSDFFLIVNDFWSAPLQIIFAMCLLWLQLNWAAFAGLGAMIILMPANWWITTQISRLRATVMKAKDKRIRLMNEILAGIKVLKLYAWEDSFSEKCRLSRELELSELRKGVIFQSIMVLIFNMAPFLVTAFSFTTFILIDSSNQLTSQKAFVSLAIFNQMRVPLNNLPRMITTFSTVLVSLKRVTKFMLSNELDPNAVERINLLKRTQLNKVNQDFESKFDIVVENGKFSWNSEPDEDVSDVDKLKKSFQFKPIQANLEQINLVVPRGKLVAIVGQVGSGKTTLLNALLGNLNKLEGRVLINDSISYVAQQAWIQNATFRDNILYLNPMDEKKFAQIIEACALGPDIAVLSGGVDTEIGEKGINVSGGQKQRIAIARACYAGGSLFLFDDPLSALDAHVGRHIFDQIIGPNGMLNQTTRVLVTHRFSELPECDFIYVLKNGQIVESGTYKQLMERSDGEFAQFLQQQQRDNENQCQPELSSTTNDETKLIDQYFKEIDELSFCSIEGDDDVELRQNSIQLELIRLQSIGESSPANHRTSSIISSSSVTVHNKVSPMLSSSSGNSATDNNTLLIDTKLPMADQSPTVAKFNDFNRANSQISNNDAKSQTTPIKPTLDDSEKTRLTSDEKSATGSVKWSHYFAYMRQLGLLSIFFTFAFHMASLAFNLGASQWLAKWSQITDQREPALGNLTQTSSHGLILYNHMSLSSRSDLFFLGIYIVLSFMECILILALTLTLGLATLRGARLLHEQMLERIIRAPLVFFDTNPLGRILNRFSRDVDVCDLMLNMYMRMTLIQIGRLFASVLIIALEAPYIMGVIIPVAIVYYTIQRVYITSSRQLRRIESVTRSPIYSHFSETITGANTIRAFGKVDQFVQESHSRIDTNNRSSYAAVAISRWLAIRLEFLGYMVVFANALYFVIMRKEVDASSAGLTLSYSLLITRYLNNFINASSNLETNIVSVERCYEYTTTPVEAEYRKAPSPTSAGSSTNLIPSDWPTRGQIQFENYSTRYRPDLDLVLNHLNFSIQPNQRVGVVGRTGAGKSSLTLALFRIIERAEGRILIDNQDIAELPLFDLRSRLTIIPQDPVLFTGTLRFNLDPFASHDDSELWSALELTSLKSFVESLDHSLDHQISEGGENLSAGQKQLVCLARALVRRSKVLIMDEATAAVDLETDELIQRTIRNHFVDCTILTIAHRINTIIDYDQVLVLDQGTIAEFDSPQTLLANPHSIFRSLATEAGLFHSNA